MLKDTIGQDAGILWHAIDANGIMSFPELKKAVKLDAQRIHLALGWLARENKVYLNELEGELHISLIY